MNVYHALQIARDARLEGRDAEYAAALDEIGVDSEPVRQSYRQGHEHAYGVLAAHARQGEPAELRRMLGQIARRQWIDGWVPVDDLSVGMLMQTSSGPIRIIADDRVPPNEARLVSTTTAAMAPLVAVNLEWYER